MVTISPMDVVRCINIPAVRASYLEAHRMFCVHHRSGRTTRSSTLYWYVSNLSGRRGNDTASRSFVCSWPTQPHWFPIIAVAVVHAVHRFVVRHPTVRAVLTASDMTTDDQRIKSVLDLVIAQIDIRRKFFCGQRSRGSLQFAQYVEHIPSDTVGFGDIWPVWCAMVSVCPGAHRSTSPGSRSS